MRTFGRVRRNTGLHSLPYFHLTVDYIMITAAK